MSKPNTQRSKKRVGDVAKLRILNLTHPLQTRKKNLMDDRGMTKQRLQDALVAESLRADQNWAEIGTLKEEIYRLKDPRVSHDERVKELKTKVIELENAKYLLGEQLSVAKTAVETRQKSVNEIYKQHQDLVVEIQKCHVAEEELKSKFLLEKSILMIERDESRHMLEWWKQNFVEARKVRIQVDTNRAKMDRVFAIFMNAATSVDKKILQEDIDYLNNLGIGANDLSRIGSDMGFNIDTFNIDTKDPGKV